MIDEKETTIDYDAILGDFDGFLKERNWEGCEAVIDNLRDLGEYTKGIELAKRLTARKMTLPSDYGDEENVHFREQDNPLKDVRVEGFNEEEIW